MRTVQIRNPEPRPRQVPWKWGGKGQPHACGFCSTLMVGGIVEHRFCRGKVKDGLGKNRDWSCPCAEAGHPDAGNPGPVQDPLE
jgi:hypothetical protein